MTSQPNAFAIRGATNVLAKAALLDPRIGAGDEGTILAWAEILQPMAGYPADLLAAVTAHYSTSTERILPADVLRLARGIKNDRINASIGNDSAPPELHNQLPPATVEARRLALAEAAANIGKAHDVDTRETFAAAPKPPKAESQATIAAKVARVRAAAPPEWQGLTDEQLKFRAGLDAEVACDWRDDSDGRTCMLAAGHLGPHHPSNAESRAAR